MTTSRSGFTLIESSVAAVLLAAVLSIAVALLTSIARQRQAASLHAKAVIAADNLMERLTAEPFDAITADRADELRQASPVAEELPEAAVDVRVSDVDGPPLGKRVEVEVKWQLRADGPPSRHAVAAWVFDAKGKR